MSDLQISLIIIGIIIIAGVVVYNWTQQLRYRRKMQQAFDHEHEDVLLDKEKRFDESERIEPQLNKGFISKLRAASGNAAQSNQKTSDTLSPITELSDSTEEDGTAMCYVVNIQTDTLIPVNKLTTLLHQQDFDKPIRWYGQHSNGSAWGEITPDMNMNDNGYLGLKGCLQLVDRSGPVSEVDLSKFRDLVQDFAATQVNAMTSCPDIVKSHEQAVLLDQFCAKVDVMIGVNIISKDGGAFVGTKIRALAEASGFKLESEGEFKYYDDNSLILFSLCNHESEPFRPDNMKSLTTNCITFLLDVPRVANGKKVFEQMIHITRIFSNTLGGIMADDNRTPLSDSGIIKIKQQLGEIQTTMKAHNIPAGSKNAKELFV